MSGRALLAILIAWVSAADVASAAGDPARGADLYQRRCGACHSLDGNRTGPMHRGVYGRRSGAVSGFAYSPALKRLGVVWTAATLDRWLQGPSVMAPGTAMGFSLPNPDERADVIAYLKQQSPPVRPAPRRSRR